MGEFIRAFCPARMTPERILRRFRAATTFAPMAKITDLRTVDPLRTGISVDTVAIPDFIDNLKALNEAWGHFEKSGDVAHLNEFIRMAGNGETLCRLAKYRGIGIRASLRTDRLTTLEQKLEEANKKKAALIAHTMSEESEVWKGVRMAETQEWLDKRLEKLSKRINNRRGWSEMRAANKAAKAA
jgi:hypothetical protein